MARIAGVELNDGWRVIYALTRIKGIGWSLAGKITLTLKISEAKRVGELTTDDLSALSRELENYVIEGDLVRETRGNIQRLKVTGTKRGARKTVGAFKKEQLTKMQQQTKKEETK